MALTIKMRIDEQPEHSYVFSTGDGGQIELIPLSVVQNGTYRPSEENQAFNLVTVNVPQPVVEQLNITANGTYEQAGVVYDVVTVNVQPILDTLNETITVNGAYDFYPTNDGYGEAHITVDVPQSQPTLVALTDTITQNGPYTALPTGGADGFSDVNLTIDVPSGAIFETEFTPTGDAEYINLSEGQMPTLIYVVSKDFSTVMNGGGRNVLLQYLIAIDPETTNYYFKMYSFKGSSSSTTSQSSNTAHTNLMQSVPTSNSATALVYDSANDRIGFFGKDLSDTTTGYGFGNGTQYQLFAIY